MIELPERLLTRRLLLRAPRLEDDETVNAAIRDSFAELNAWMDWAAVLPTVADTRAFCALAQRQRSTGTDCPLLMLEGPQGTVVGATGYARIDPAVPSFEIGYWVRTSHTGRGLALEATEALTRHAFEALGARRVEIRMDERNRRSSAVPERLGFELEGVLRNHVRDHHGRLRNTRVYALVSPDGLKALPPAPGQPR